MNILVVTREFPPYVLGGLSYHLAYLYNRIEELGHQVTILAGKCSGYHHEAERLIPDDADIFRIPFGSLRGHRVRFPLALKRFLRDFDTSEYDILFAHTELPFSFDLPMISKYHDCEREMRRYHTGIPPHLRAVDNIADPIRRWVEQRSLRVSDVVVFNSDLCRRGWRRHYDIPVPSAVIHNGVDRSVFYPRPSADDDEYVLFVGDEERKGLSRVVDYAETSSCEVRLVGLDEVDSPHITAVGRVDSSRLAELYSGAVATIHPAKFEAFGNIVLESLACGTPVVTTKRCGASEILDDSCGIVTEDIAAGVDCCRRLDGADCVRTAERYRWSDVAERTVDLAAQIVG